RSTSGSGDDDLDPAAGSGLCVGAHAVGRAMGRDDLAFERNCQGVENGTCGAQGRPIGLAPHDETDNGFGHAPWPLGLRPRESSGEEASDYRDAFLPANLFPAGARVNGLVALIHGLLSGTFVPCSLRHWTKPMKIDRTSPVRGARAVAALY